MKKYQTHLKPKTIFFLLLTLTVTNSFAADDEKPYQVIDGKIDENTFEGWRTYNGGGCGQCHGRGGSGKSGKNLAESLVFKNNDKEKFKNYITNGVPNTLMKPHKNDGRVMANLDNLYAYLKARADGVLGSGNLIKLPLGK
jgi:mono/diheme cytochrome c family protein